MRKLRILLTSVLSLMLLLGCQVINKVPDTVELENDYEVLAENIIVESISGDLAYALDTPVGLQKAIDEIIDVVAIVRIDSVNYSNWYPMTKEYDLPYTYGEASVIENLKGELLAKKITYRRFGGILPYEEYIKASNASEKVTRLQKENNVDVDSLKGTKIISRWDGDIEVEVGKTYLVLMINDPKFHQENEYWFEGYQYGLREVQLEPLKIKNNVTGEWEQLSALGLNFGY